jgi:hypothetical protein
MEDLKKAESKKLESFTFALRNRVTERTSHLAGL